MTGRQRQRRVRQALGAVAVFTVVISTLAVVAFRNANEAKIQRHNAEEERTLGARLLAESLQFYEEAGRQRLIEAGRPVEALPFLVAAREATEAIDGISSPSLRMLFAGATRALPLSPPLQHQDTVLSAVFSPPKNGITEVRFFKNPEDRNEAKKYSIF